LEVKQVSNKSSEGDRRPVSALRTFAFAVVVCVALLAIAIPAWAHQDGSSGEPTPSVIGKDSVNAEAAEKVLVLDSTVSGGVNSKEALFAASLGYGVDVVDNAAWTAMTSDQFASYHGIIIGDPTCNSTLPAALTGNVATWTPVVNGNVIVIGTDAVFHYSQGGQVLLEKSMAFAMSQAEKTNLYLDLSCIGDSNPNAGNSILNALSPGWTWGQPGCEDAIHVVATNPFLIGMTDADLSNWSCSVHEYATAWPADFVPIALDTDAPPNFTSPDGFSGSPYVLGRGPGLNVGNISLTPESGIQDAGKDYVLTALVQEGGTALADTTVTFTCKMEGAADVTGTAKTDSSGVATFTYTRTVGGVDTCTASYVDSKSVTQTSNSATVNWNGPVPIQPNFTG